MAVEWKLLSDVCSVHTGMQLNRDDMLEEGLYPVMNGGRTSSGYTNTANEKANSITISQGGESAGFVNWIDTDFWAGAHCYVFSEFKISKRYLFHFLKNREEQIRAKRQGAGIPGLNRNALMRLSIPVPSKSEQDSLVSKLDTFTSLITKLDEEIELRQQQLVHYRNVLLDLNENEDFEIKTLGLIGTFTRGNGIQKSDFVEEGKPCIHYGQIHTRFGISTDKAISYISESQYKRCKKAKYGDIILATTSEDVEAVCKPVAWLSQEEVAVSTDAFIYNHQCNPIFMANQFLTDRYFTFKASHATGAKVIRISDSAMSKYEIYLPSLEIQNEIGNKLTTFTNLISKLEEERDLRQKQYEYYREKLLSYE